MSDPRPAGLFHFEDPDDYLRLRETLAAAGYDDEGMSGLLGSGGLAGASPETLPALLRRTGAGSPLEVLVRLFMLGVDVDRGAAEKVLAPLGLSWWVERGLVQIRGDHVTASVLLRPYQGLVVAYDFHRRLGASLPRDYVMGISASSLTLAGLTVRRPNRTALDVGTGCGFQAFLAAQHSNRVVATDTNPRAVEMARFNAALNRLTAVECREGDLFEPVAGETFDLIVSNPPFVVSPDNFYAFLHSGMAGDEICRTIARHASKYLAEGGYCQFLANWTSVDGEDWRDRLAEWVDGTDCDAWILRRGSQAPEEYAAAWIETEDAGDGFRRAFDSWMDYYEELDVASIDSGLVTLRRTAASPWFRADDSPPTMTFPAGDDVARAFELQDFLCAHDDGALLATRFRLAHDVRLDQQSQQAGPGWETIATQLRRTEGLHWLGGIDSSGARLLAQCDGTRSMAELLAGLAASLGGQADDAAGEWAAVVRRLVEQGFLLPT